MLMDSQDRQEIKAHLREGAREFRKLSLQIDKDPDSIKNYCHLEPVKWLAHMFVPEDYGAIPLKIRRGKQFFFMSCQERVLALENLSYGDVGVVLASPGPSLSGHIIHDLGTEEQKQRYYHQLLKEPTWTFFALSEPNKGSDAANLCTYVSKTTEHEGDYRLNGEKYFIGNGCRAQVGVVFARRNKGPLGIEIFYFETKDRQGFSKSLLPTLGVRGAAISHLKFDECVVPEKDLVGSHLPASRRGLWGAIQTFNQMRPGVAAMALGLSQAVYDYIVENKKVFKESQKTLLNQFQYQLQSVRSTIHKAALVADNDPSNGTHASIAKVRAVELAEKITAATPLFFGPGSLLEDTYLNKWFRDGRSFEYMEGTSIIQKLRLFQAFRTGKWIHD